MLECADAVLPKTYAFNIAAIGAAKTRAAKMPGRSDGRSVICRTGNCERYAPERGRVGKNLFSKEEPRRMVSLSL
jgi:hypothetical protein